MRSKLPPRVRSLEVNFGRVYPLRLITSFGLLFEFFPFERRGELLSACCRGALFSPEGFNAKTSLCRVCLKSTPAPAGLVEEFKTTLLSADTFTGAAELHLPALEAVLVGRQLAELVDELALVPPPDKHIIPRWRYKREVRRLAHRRPLL